MKTDSAAQKLPEDDEFRTAVRKGIEQADCGDFIEEEEMGCAGQANVVAGGISKKEPRPEQIK